MCTTCGATTTVEKTEHFEANGQIRRKRICRNGHRATTVEVWIPKKTIGRPPKNKEKWDRMKEARKQCEKSQN